MARPAYTARPREALLIYRNADGMLELGQGRMRIAPGAINYFGRVTRALGHVLDLPGGAEAFAQGDALGHMVTIMPPKVATVPPNAWTLPDDIEAGTAAGVALGPADANSRTRTGTGAGCGSTIVFDPDDWPRRGDPTSPASHAVLLKLLMQANAYAEGTSTPESTPDTAGARQGQLQLTCRPAKVGTVLAFPYVIENPGPDEVYVMDAVACAEAETHGACAGERPAVVFGPTGDAIVGTFIPPMPTDRRLAEPVIPLARLLPVGGVLEHRLEIPAPYAETSPWLPDLPVEQHQAADIGGVVLAVGYWPVSMEGLVVTEAAYAPGLYAIAPSCGGALVSLRFPTTGLQFSRRADSFPRSLA